MYPSTFIHKILTVLACIILRTWASITVDPIHTFSTILTRTANTIIYINRTWWSWKWTKTVFVSQIIKVTQNNTGMYAKKNKQDLELCWQHLEVHVHTTKRYTVDHILEGHPGVQLKVSLYHVFNLECH